MIGHSSRLPKLFVSLLHLLADPNNNVAPSSPPSTAAGGYTITSARLAELRSTFMYWYFDKDMYGGRGDYQFDIHASMTQLHKNLNFQLPFYGFRFNYTRVRLFLIFLRLFNNNKI